VQKIVVNRYIYTELSPSAGWCIGAKGGNNIVHNYEYYNSLQGVLTSCLSWLKIVHLLLLLFPLIWSV